MKTKKLAKHTYSSGERAESFIYPGELDKGRKEQSLEGLRTYRSLAENKRTDKDRLMSQLLQLRFIMEDYIKDESYNQAYHFGFFLKEYIIRLEKKNKEFADEINMDPSELSQIINKHRPPNDRLFIRLDIHSNRNFPAIMWFKLIEKEKAYELTNDRRLRDQEKKYVKKNLQFSL